MSDKKFRPVVTAWAGGGRWRVSESVRRKRAEMRGAAGECVS